MIGTHKLDQSNKVIIPFSSTVDSNKVRLLEFEAHTAHAEKAFT